MKNRWVLLSLLCFVLCSIIYVESNLDKVNAVKADYYLKNGNYEKAMKNYEDAFEAGCIDSKARDNYVDLVISKAENDSGMQKRLLKFLEYSPNDEAKKKVTDYLSELRFSAHSKYGDNYIEHCVYNQKIIRWAENPITYVYVNPDVAPSYFVQQINTAFQTWEKALEGKVRFEENKNNPKILIKFDNLKTEVDNDEKYYAAVTRPITNGNKLNNMITDYYMTDPSGNYFTENQIYNTALHEIGHELGFLGHCDYKKSVMHMSTDSTTVTNDLRKSLTNSDINTVELLYDIQPDISESKNVNSEYAKEVILGSEAEVVNAKMREAKIYIKKAPNLPAGYIDLAEAYIALGNYPSAINALTQALPLAQEDIDTRGMIYYNLAVTYYLMSDYNQAQESLRQSGLYGKTESANNLLAQICLSSGEKDKAISLYEGLIIKHPNNIEYTISLANIYVRDRKYLKARAVLKEFIANNPEEKNNPRLAPYGIIKLFL